MDRRAFVNWIGVGVLATSLPVAIAACQSSSPPTADGDSATDSAADSGDSADGFTAIGTVEELETAGFIANDRFQGQRVIVIRDPADESSLIAVDSVCPHAACTVTWEENVFDCACHGSQFTADGAVSAGPAAEPLGSFEAKIEGDQVLVKV